MGEVTTEVSCHCPTNSSWLSQWFCLSYEVGYGRGEGRVARDYSLGIVVHNSSSNLEIQQQSTAAAAAVVVVVVFVFIIAE